MKAKYGAVKLSWAMEITRTAVNNYINGDTDTQDRVRAPIASYYLRVQRGKTRLEDLKYQKKPKPRNPRKLRRVAETRAGYAPGELEARLKRALPPTREEAVPWVRQLEDLFRAHPDEAPANVGVLVTELLRLAETLPSAEPPPAGEEQRG